uniref:Uncharacterized protein n=1 Tax=Oryza glumipatula TaxID=40148 RepID=A0A0E0BM49_9ORYZ
MGLSYLRVLDLSDSLVQTIPDYVGNLIHLCLLGLDGTNISCLPESIGSLQNLQIFNLQRCKSLDHLPLATTQLCNLRRLGLDETPINHVPKGIGGLKFLNDLEGFPIGGGIDNAKMQDGWNFEELAHLSQLRRLHMIKLERSTLCNCADSFMLTDKKHLKALHLSFIEPTNEAYSEERVTNAEKIFEQLKPPHNLEELCIFDFLGSRFPTWLGTAHLSSLEYLKLIDCHIGVHLPPMGQLPSLKYLSIRGATSITKIGPEFVGRGVSNLASTEVVAFPKLERLVIKEMPNWEEWSFTEEEEEEEDGAALKQKGEEAPYPTPHLLPCLNQLQLLRALPRQLGQQATSLHKVFLEEVNSLKTLEGLLFLSNTLQVVKCKGLESISNLPQVKELNVACCPNLRHVQDYGWTRICTRWLRYGSKGFKINVDISMEMSGRSTSGFESHIIRWHKKAERYIAHKEEKAYKLAIVGTGGIGKTTLAQKVFNDQKLKGTFNKHAWICVSQDYTPVSVLKQLLRTMEIQHKQEES